jgi:hypothetical protein
MLRTWRNEGRGSIMEMMVAAEAKRGLRPRGVLRMRVWVKTGE